MVRTHLRLLDSSDVHQGFSYGLAGEHMDDGVRRTFETFENLPSYSAAIRPRSVGRSSYGPIANVKVTATPKSTQREVVRHGEKQVIRSLWGFLILHIAPHRATRPHLRSAPNAASRWSPPTLSKYTSIPSGSLVQQLIERTIVIIERRVHMKIVQ